MLRLLQIEFQKLKHSRSSKVLTIIYFGLFTLLSLFASIHFEFGGIDFQLADEGIFEFPYIWHFNTYFAALLKLFLAIVIVTMMSTEYTNRTLKQNLIDGMSKKEFILSKFYTLISLAAFSTIFLFLVSLTLGLFFSESTDISVIFSEMEYLVAFFVKLLGFFSFCMFLGILVKKSAFALGVLFLWWLFESIFLTVLKFLILKDETTTYQIAQFFPLESMANLVKEPISRLKMVKDTASQLGSPLSNDYHVYWYQLAIVLVWTFIFVFLSYKLLKKRDL